MQISTAGARRPYLDELRQRGAENRAESRRQAEREQDRKDRLSELEDERRYREQQAIAKEARDLETWKAKEDYKKSLEQPQAASEEDNFIGVINGAIASKDKTSFASAESLPTYSNGMFADVIKETGSLPKGGMVGVRQNSDGTLAFGRMKSKDSPVDWVDLDRENSDAMYARAKINYRWPDEDGAGGGKYTGPKASGTAEIRVRNVDDGKWMPITVQEMKSHDTNKVVSYYDPNTDTEYPVGADNIRAITTDQIEASKSRMMQRFDNAVLSMPFIEIDDNGEYKPNSFVANDINTKGYGGESSDDIVQTLSRVKLEMKRVMNEGLETSLPANAADISSKESFRIWLIEAMGRALKRPDARVSAESVIVKLNMTVADYLYQSLMDNY